MANTVACTINGWKWCSVGGTAWTSLSSPTSSNIYGGGSYIGLISFTTPSFSGSSISITLSLNIIKLGDSGPTSSSPYVKIGTVNPGTNDILDPHDDTAIGAVGPYNQISVSGLTIQSQHFTFTINNSKLQPSKTYYLWIFGDAAIQPYQHSSWNSISLTYQDQITVSYNANGGSGAPASQTGTSPITLSTVKPTKSNCRFNHWNTKSDGTGTKYSSGGKYSGTSDITLYAIWDYKLTFYGDNDGVVTNITTGESGDSLSYWKTHNIDYNNSNLIVVYDSSSGKVFNGWSPSLPYSSNAPRTFTPAVSSRTFTVTFYDGYTSNPLKVLTNVAYGSSIDPSDFPTTPTRPGYKFAGWQGNTSYVTSDRSVVAMWGNSPIWIMTADGWVKYIPKENT